MSLTIGSRRFDPVVPKVLSGEVIDISVCAHCGQPIVKWLWVRTGNSNWSHDRDDEICKVHCIENRSGPELREVQCNLNGSNHLSDTPHAEPKELVS